MSDIDLLQKIGLSKYQALLYACLLRKGPLDARNLSRESHVPMGKIYETLSQLLINKIITEHAGRPKTYEAIVPEIAFQRIYMKYYLDHEKQREDLKNTITRLEQIMERKNQAAPTLENLQIMYSNENILNYFIRVHNEAKKEVIYVTQVRYGSYESEVDERTVQSLMNNLVSLLKRGISVKVLYPDSPYLNFFSQIASCITDPYILQMYQDLVEIRVCNTQHNFVLVDETTCIFEPEDQRDLARPFAMIRIRDAALNSQLRVVFGGLWKNAIPLDNP
jgi:HTH-type transcriptional regulator, sugar sensing transcriptional regulator